MERVSKPAVVSTLVLLAAALIVGPGWAKAKGVEINLPLISPQSGNADAPAAQRLSAVAGADAAQRLSLSKWYPAAPAALTAPCQEGTCLGLAGAALRPSTNDAEWTVVDDSECIYVTGGNTRAVWSAPVYLEQGATVNRLTMYALDNDTYRNSVAWFTIYDRSSRILEEWRVQSQGSAEEIATHTAQGRDHTVDHANYHYLINWQPNQLGSDMQVCGFLIDYVPNGLAGAGTSAADDDLPDEIIGGALQFFSSCPSGLCSFKCASQGIPRPEDLPAIVPLGSDAGGTKSGVRQLCLYGFPVGERIDVALATLGGGYAAHGAFQMQRSASPTPVPTVRPLPAKPLTIHPSMLAAGRLEIGGIERLRIMSPRLTLKEPPKLDGKLAPLEVQLPWGADEPEWLDVIQVEPVVEDQAGSDLLEAGIVDGVSVLSVPLWWPVSLPSGVWIVAAVASEDEDTVSVYFEPLDGISTRPDVEVNPFEYHHCDSYEPGATVVIEGAGLEPDGSLLLGLYREAETGYELADSLRVSTDEQGSFAADHGIPSSYQDGEYIIVPAPDIHLDPDQEVGWTMLPRPCFHVSTP